MNCISFDRSKVVNNLFPATASRKAIDDSIDINWNEASTSSQFGSPIKSAAIQQSTDPSGGQKNDILEKLETLIKETKQMMENKPDNGITVQ